MMKRPNELLTAAHPWLSSRKAHWILQTRVHTFLNELEMDEDEAAEALAKATYIYENMTENDLRNTIARFEEHYLDPIHTTLHSAPYGR